MVTGYMMTTWVHRLTRSSARQMWSEPMQHPSLLVQQPGSHSHPEPRLPPCVLAKACDSLGGWTSDGPGVRLSTWSVSGGGRERLCRVLRRTGTPFGAPGAFSQGSRQRQAGLFRHEKGSDLPCPGRLSVAWGPETEPLTRVRLEGPIPGFRILAFSDWCLNVLVRNPWRL